jgi:hypothetical protein
MRPNATNTTVPPIPTPGTRQLSRAIDSLRRHVPELDDHVSAIRTGDNELLMEYVRRTQQGDPDAAQIAIWAIFPRMCAVVRSRFPRVLWRAAADDLIALVYLAIIDLDRDEGTRFLNDKLVSRARRRYERTLRLQQSTDEKEVATEVVSVVGDDVEARVFARLDLAALREAIESGDVSERAWSTIISAHFADREQPMPGGERMKLLRARRRLESWRSQAA